MMTTCTRIYLEDYHQDTDYYVVHHKCDDCPIYEEVFMEIGNNCEYWK